MIEVDLTWAELQYAAGVGVRRHVHARRSGYRESNGIGENEATQWYAHMLGAMGELAFAKGLGIYWPATITRSDPDLPPDWQVRTAAYHSELIVRPDDGPGFRYVLVTGRGVPPVFQVHGWILGQDARREDWFTNKGNGRPPAYWVPKSALEPL